ncbi:MAG: hypothetical protein KatS3mg104_0775 [Phycisphaerae bacterium]|nr:MAG: hypothetical protein KatS3mg104_0775 [Phycisphaerae bacterium]
MLISFWEDEFASYEKRLVAEIISPIQNKVGRLLLAPVIRNVLCQVTSRIDFRFMMDRRRIFVANLSKGKLGDDQANFLGAILITQFRLASMSRANLSEQARVPFNLVVDEFHNFTTDSFATILAESRKYGLHLTLSHQHLAQLPSDLAAAVLGNVGTIIAFRTGEADAERLAREFGNDYRAGHFTDLANHEIRLKSQGDAAEPVFVRTLPPLPAKRKNGDTLIRRSREKYAAKRAVVEDKIARWLA